MKIKRWVRLGDVSDCLDDSEEVLDDLVDELPDLGLPIFQTEDGCFWGVQAELNLVPFTQAEVEGYVGPEDQWEEQDED